jgi:uncharacterized membrane protein YozB (DUF420 family)
MVITSASYAVMKIERRVHAQALLLTAAVVVNVVIVVLFMLPRFLNNLPFVSTAYLPDQVPIVHHTFSLITLAPTLTVVLS